jgi:hypothetical protein
MKKYFLVLTALVLLTSCGNKGYITGEEAAKMEVKGDVDTDICKQFDADFVYSATGKPIVKVEPSPVAGIFSCNYYTDYKEDFYKDEGNSVVMPGGPSINIVLDNLNVEKQKEGVTFMGATLGEDPRINMEHYIVYREDGSIWEVALVINPNRFVWTDYSHNALTDEELILFAAKMADRMQGRKMDIQKNPVADAEPVKEAVVPLPSNEDLVRNFFTLIGENKIQEALAMMDANEDTKQGWGVNFNLIKSLKIKSLEPVFPEEWTDSRVTYKVVLDAQVKEEMYGWSNGENYRWVTLEKTGDKWLVHELANNP